MNIKHIEENHKKIVAILAVSSVLFSFIFLQFTVDDSYITFRYAKNLIEHGVWNWNITGEKVEAYTNFLYAILAIIPEATGINTPLFFKLLGASAILYLSIRLYGLIAENKISYIMALTFLLFNPFVYIHAYSGLETPLFIALIFELTILISAESIIDIKHEKLLFIVLLMLPLTRPEGAIFSLLGFSLLVCKEKTIKSKCLFVGIVLVSIGYFVWRYQYFGYLFPNTFYVKSAHGFSIDKIIIYIFNNVHVLGSALFLLFLVKNKHFRILLGAAIFLNIFLYGKSDLQMDYADRFPFQTLFPFFLAAFVLVNNRNTSIMVFIVVSFILGGIFSNKSEFVHLATYYPKAIQSHAKLGVALSKFKNENLSLMIGDAGMVPYFSEWHTYDSIGLANVNVAHDGFSLEYMKKIQPDLIIMYSTTPDKEGIRLDDYNQHYIYSYITESQQYSFVGASRWQDNYYMLAFLKNSAHRFEEIKQTIQDIDSETREFKVSKNDFLLQKYLIYPGTE